MRVPRGWLDVGQFSVGGDFQRRTGSNEIESLKVNKVGYLKFRVLNT